MLKTKIKYFFLITIPLAVGFSITTQGLMSYFALIYSFVILPLLEFTLPASKVNFTEEQESELLKDKFFDYIVYLALPIQWSLVIFFLFEVSSGEYLWWELIGKSLSLGAACGVLGINVAHELGHRRNSYEQRIAQGLLLSTLYMHFFIEHNKGHHKKVCTPEDPNSSRLGESLYQFLPRSIVGAFKSAMKIDRAQSIKFLLLEVLLLIIIAFTFGIIPMSLFLLAAIFGILELETVNYIEHYGLTRNLNIKTGKYEKVLPVHSWNSNHALGRMALFELSRHSDHHANAHRKYQILRHFDESPQFPTGYPGMMVLSTIPFLWFKVMNKRVEKWAIATEM